MKVTNKYSPLCHYRGKTFRYNYADKKIEYITFKEYDEFDNETLMSEPIIVIAHDLDPKKWEGNVSNSVTDFFRKIDPINAN